MSKLAPIDKERYISRFKPSYDTAIVLEKLYETYQVHEIRDIMGTRVLGTRGVFPYIEEAQAIAQYNKRVSGDFSKVSHLEIMTTLSQMKQNEINYQKQLEIRKTNSEENSNRFRK